MYYYVNGKKTRRNLTSHSPSKEQFVESVRENLHDNRNAGGKCPTWVFIVLGIIAALIAGWLIYCIINGKKSVTVSPLKSESSV